MHALDAALDILDTVVEAAALQWPDRRVCNWDCPWPSYCVDCHITAWNTMLQARENLVWWMAHA